MSLSDKTYFTGFPYSKNIIETEDVKDFIRLLKDCVADSINGKTGIMDAKFIFDGIDELAGNKLL